MQQLFFSPILAPSSSSCSSSSSPSEGTPASPAEDHDESVHSHAHDSFSATLTPLFASPDSRPLLARALERAAASAARDDIEMDMDMGADSLATLQPMGVLFDKLYSGASPSERLPNAREVAEELESAGQLQSLAICVIPPQTPTASNNDVPVLAASSSPSDLSFTPAHEAAPVVSALPRDDSSIPAPTQQSLARHQQQLLQHATRIAMDPLSPSHSDWRGSPSSLRPQHHRQTSPAPSVSAVAHAAGPITPSSLICMQASTPFGSSPATQQQLQQQQPPQFSPSPPGGAAVASAPGTGTATPSRSRGLLYSPPIVSAALQAQLDTPFSAMQQQQQQRSPGARTPGQPSALAVLLRQQEEKERRMRWMAQMHQDNTNVDNLYDADEQEENDDDEEEERGHVHAQGPATPRPWSRAASPSRRRSSIPSDTRAASLSPVSKMLLQPKFQVLLQKSTIDSGAALEQDESANGAVEFHGGSMQAKKVYEEESKSTAPAAEFPDSPVAPLSAAPTPAISAFSPRSNPHFHTLVSTLQSFTAQAMLSPVAAAARPRASTPPSAAKLSAHKNSAKELLRRVQRINMDCQQQQQQQQQQQLQSEELAVAKVDADADPSLKKKDHGWEVATDPFRSPLRDITHDVLHNGGSAWAMLAPATYSSAAPRANGFVATDENGDEQVDEEEQDTENAPSNNNAAKAVAAASPVRYSLFKPAQVKVVVAQRGSLSSAAAAPIARESAVAAAAAPTAVEPRLAPVAVATAAAAASAAAARPLSAPRSSASTAGAHLHPQPTPRPGTGRLPSAAAATPAVVAVGAAARLQARAAPATAPTTTAAARAPTIAAPLLSARSSRASTAAAPTRDRAANAPSQQRTHAALSHNKNSPRKPKSAIDHSKR